MHNYKRIISIILIGVIVSLSFTGCIGNSETINETKALKDGLTEIEIDADSYNVIIEQGEEANVSYNALKDAKINFTYENGKLFFKDESKLTFLSGNANREIIITIPKDKELTGMNVETDSGNITISNIKCEMINVKVDSGNINMSSDIAKKLIAKADSGNVDLNGELENIEADVDSGNLNLSGNVYIVKAETDSGDITIDSKKSQSEMRLNLDTDFGKITINGKSIN